MLRVGKVLDKIKKDNLANPYTAVISIIQDLVIYFMGIVVVFHVTACLFYLIVSLDPEQQFERDNELIDANGFRIYVVCLYWIVQTVTTVGYGDIKVQQFPIKVFSVFLMIAGVVFISTIVNEINEILMTLDR